MTEEQPIHTQHPAIFYTKATSVNSWWLDDSCVVAAKDDPFGYVIFDRIESAFYHLWKISDWNQPLQNQNYSKEKLITYMPHDLIYDSALCPKSLSIRSISHVILIFVVPNDQI
jgi:hypothetical protein